MQSTVQNLYFFNQNCLYDENNPLRENFLQTILSFSNVSSVCFIFGGFNIFCSSQHFKFQLDFVNHYDQFTKKWCLTQESSTCLLAVSFSQPPSSKIQCINCSFLVKAFLPSAAKVPGNNIFFFLILLTVSNHQQTNKKNYYKSSYVEKDSSFCRCQFFHSI